MSVNKQGLDLIVESPGYPWQIIEGDGQTIIILRHRMKLALQEIEQLRGVRIEGCSWSALTRGQEKSLYAGLLDLKVYYKEITFGDKKEIFTQAAEEEVLCRQLFTGRRSESLGKLTPPRSAGQGASIFPHIILGSREEYSENEHMSKGQRNWVIKAPWQAWLFGKGIKGEPRIVKVHIAQTGLSSLLLEVILSLESEREILEKKESGQGLILSSPRECLLFLQDDTMEEIIGLVEKREFNTCREEVATQELIVDSVKKTTLVYINNSRGGERILTASCTTAESNRMPYSPLPQVPPPYHIFASHSPVLMRIDEHKALLKTNHSWMVEYHTEEAESSKPVKKEESAAITARPRIRPLEKWLKPKDKPSPIRKENWKVLSIKLLH